jgi:hypothetical protein
MAERLKSFIRSIRLSLAMNPPMQVSSSNSLISLAMTVLHQE